MNPIAERAQTPREFGRRYRLSPDHVRELIRRGELGALNLAPTKLSKPRFLILPRHADEWERRRQVVVPAKSAPRRRKRTVAVDYFPDHADDGGAA